MQSQLQHMVTKLQNFTSERLAEVDDFIDFLQKQDQERSLRMDFSKGANTTFHKVWDNEDDAIYDNL